eukprot:5258883-Pyramimonas_sp.AAC.1
MDDIHGANVPGTKTKRFELREGVCSCKRTNNIVHFVTGIGLDTSDLYPARYDFRSHRILCV